MRVERYLLLEAVMGGADTAASPLGHLRPPWMLDALCADYPEVDFHPGRGESVEPARAVCAACPVKAECLEYALDNHEKWGVWGGLSGRERRELQRERRMAA